MPWNLGHLEQQPSPFIKTRGRVPSANNCQKAFLLAAALARKT